MKKLIILLALAAGMVFASCDDDDSLAEMNADRVMSYNKDIAVTADYLSNEVQGKVFNDYSFEIPYLVLWENKLPVLTLNLNDLQSIECVIARDGDGKAEVVKYIRLAFN